MWTKLEEEKPKEGLEVICFNREWIDEDFNPNGTRLGFLNGDNEFTTAYWWDYQDTYVTVSKSQTENKQEFSLKIKKNTEPTHWMEIPKRPLSIEEEVTLLIEEKGLDKALIDVRVWLSYNSKSVKFNNMLDILLTKSSPHQ